MLIVEKSLKKSYEDGVREGKILMWQEMNISCHCKKIIYAVSVVDDKTYNRVFFSEEKAMEYISFIEENYCSDKNIKCTRIDISEKMESWLSLLNFMGETT